jgi:L-alanine-DL-glutamate epimerase-like enolase superfamily enzyme
MYSAEREGKETGCVCKDEPAVRDVTAAIGPGAALYVDANGGYSAGQAIRVAGQLAQHGVTWFEEPVSSQGRAGRGAAAGPARRGRRGVQLVAG